MSHRTFTASLLVAFALVAFAPAPAVAGPKDNPQVAQMIFQIVNRLMAKGDEAIVGVGRVIKAETYYKKLGQPDKALAELATLESELHDKELLFAVNALRMAIMKETSKDPEQLLKNLDGVIAAAKERMGCK